MDTYKHFDPSSIFLDVGKFWRAAISIGFMTYPTVYLFGSVSIILAAPPCTCFRYSRLWSAYLYWS
ncbi:hypothetical protein B0H12DRAFT_1096882 [Mycena haematopus]|nr:hypothetical protein B0H12DRAFT_1096882 [Mycena haematopus]